MIQVKLAKMREDALVPEYAHEGDAAADLSSALHCVLQPGERVLVPTGVSIALPAGYEAQVRPRSGLALKHGISICNTPGTVDAGYRGEIGVILINHGKEVFTIEKGMRIAQMIISKVEHAEFVLVNELDKTTRGTGGFGHTGLR